MATNEKKMNEYRIKTEKKQMRRRVLYIVMALAALLCVILVMLLFVFVVRDISVVGTMAYTEDEIIEACGIEKGDSILSISLNKLSKRLRDRFSYIKHVSIDFSLPDGIIINVDEEYTTFYTEFYGDYLLFNHGMKVVDRFDSLDVLKETRENAVEVKMEGIKSALIPGYIELEDEEKYGYVRDVISEISEAFFVYSLTSIDLTDKYDITAVYDKRITIKFGSLYDFDLKVEHAEVIMRGATENTHGSVDVSNLKEGYENFYEQ